MVMLQDEAVVVWNHCTICEREPGEDEPRRILYHWPEKKSELLCQSCWLTITACATAWLSADGDTSPKALRSRVAAALAHRTDLKVS